MKGKKMLEGQAALISWLERYQLTDTRASLLLGCHRNTIGNYRNGLYAVPYYMQLAITAIALDISPMDDFSSPKTLPYDAKNNALLGIGA